ncbi:LOG family protein [Candidatus Peregrinibacteria bacterium]|nr:LOG family protein [Candidatus Peregrinibacteria bacterium]
MPAKRKTTRKKITPKAPKKTIKTELKDKKDFRVTIFGSARLRPGDKTYKEVFNLAKDIGENGWDIITGGGPGLMDAGNAGHEVGDKDNKADSIGLIIKLPWEAEANHHLEISKTFSKFSNRLDHFMALSNAIVVMPGGIGTCLELFYTWQLVQVKHIDPVPIIVVGDMWAQLIKWTKRYPLKKGLMSKGDLDHIYVAKNNKEAMKILQKTHKDYHKGKGPYCGGKKDYNLL